MEVLQDGVLAFLAATGLAALFWLLTGWLRRREPARVMLLIPARGSGDFSGPVAQLLDLRRQLRGLPPIVICDCGLDEAGLSRAGSLRSGMTTSCCWLRRRSFRIYHKEGRYGRTLHGGGRRTKPDLSE